MRYQSQGACHFCGQLAETKCKGDLRFCRRCAKQELLPALRECIGEDELRRLVNGDDQADADTGPAVAQQAAWNDKMNRLLAGARRNGTPGAAPMGPIEFSANPIGRQLVLERALARQRGVVAPADIQRNIRRAGLRA
jgi:hypothetical protein